MNDQRLSLNEDDQTKENRRINEILKSRNSSLSSIDERVLYDKNFLLEVSTAGYNPLDTEDIENFLENRPAKNLERNLMLCGADKYLNLGQGDYQEHDLAKFVQKTNTDINIRKTDDVYLSDFSNKKDREFLLEKVEDIELTLDDVILDDLEDDEVISYKDSEDLLRKNLAKAFGSDEIKVNKVESNLTTELVRKDSNIEKTLELIKELKALGFTAEEIKKEIQIRNNG